jgi:potassium-dependent mechanosensitive channel
MKKLLLLLMVLMVGLAQAQRKPKTSTTPPPPVADTVQKAKTKESDSLVNGLFTRLEMAGLLMNKFNTQLRRVYDVRQVTEALGGMEQTIDYIDSTMQAGKSISQVNLRNIMSFKVVLVQFENRLKNIKDELNDYTGQISQGLDGIDSLMAGTNLEQYKFDAEFKPQFQGQIDQMSARFEALKNKRDSIFRSLAATETKATRLYILCNQELDEVQFRIKDYSKTVFTKTHPPIWKTDTTDYPVHLKDNLQKTFRRAQNMWLFYVQSNPLTLGFWVLLALFFWIWVKRNIRNIKEADKEAVLDQIRHLRRFPFVSALLLMLFLPSFFLNSPPAIFVESSWWLAGCLTTVLFWQEEGKQIRIFWLFLLLITAYFGIDSLLFTYSLGERWFLLLGNVLALGSVLVLLRFFYPERQKHSLIFRWGLALYFLLNLLAIVANVMGHMAIAKLLANTSTFQLVLAIGLNLFSEIISEAIFLQLETSKHSVAVEIFEYDNIRKNLRSVFNVAALLAWFFGMVWCLSFYEIILQSILELMDREIALGNMVFTPKTILIFGGTIWVSVILSNILSLVFGTTDQQFASTKKNKFGSWMILIRLTIITIGFFVAVAAAGIPIDKLAIVFGALSVGIGFGLQNVVGNLVSGIILVFEKPMQVGDVIEFGTQMGTVKQIGIRSSKITTYDGADIIVPNGDFITQRFTNWTHNKTFRRVELLIGVAYGSSVDQVSEIILRAIQEQKSVMHYPKPAVLLHDFADSAVMFRALFWTNDFDGWVGLKSETLKAIYQAFAAQGVEIPFPQRDIHVKTMPLAVQNPKA